MKSTSIIPHILTRHIKAMGLVSYHANQQTPCTLTSDGGLGSCDQEVVVFSHGHV